MQEAHPFIVATALPLGFTVTAIVTGMDVQLMAESCSRKTKLKALMESLPEEVAFVIKAEWHGQ